MREKDFFRYSSCPCFCDYHRENAVPPILPFELQHPQTRQSSLCSCLLWHSESRPLVKALIKDPLKQWWWGRGGCSELPALVPSTVVLGRERGIKLNAAFAYSATVRSPYCFTFVPSVPHRTRMKPCAYLQRTVIQSC